jgi:hypothetical protein
MGRLGGDGSSERFGAKIKTQKAQNARLAGIRIQAVELF